MLKADASLLTYIPISQWTDRIRAEYLEIRRPDRIVYTQQFCDENEKMSRHPMAPTWPATMLTTVMLAAEGPDRTRVTAKWETASKGLTREFKYYRLTPAGRKQLLDQESKWKQMASAIASVMWPAEES